MKIFTIKEEYKIQYEDPIILHVGDHVNLGKEEEEEKWKGWIWAETTNNEGWIPMQILDMPTDKKSGIVREFYSAKELNVKKGDSIEKIKSLNGWTWLKKVQSNEEGWIPNDNIE